MKTAKSKERLEENIFSILQTLSIKEQRLFSFNRANDTLTFQQPFRV